MAKAKKSKKVEQVQIENESQQLESIGEIKLEQKKYEECEWCFQFDNDKPQIFAWTDSEMQKNEDPKIVFTITNTENSYISFTNGETNKTFRIFARELSEEGKLQRERQRDLFKNNENGSENKETQA